MKKLIKKFAFVLLGLFIVTLLSCENFLIGSEIKQNLEDNIEYSNSEEVDITITVNNLYGTLSGSTSGKYKVFATKSYPISFEESDSYQFVGWKIYDSSKEESENGSVIKIEDPSSTSTNFSVVDNAEGYTISPDCKLRPSVLSATPLYQTNGVSRDRTIIVNFDRDLDSSNFIFSSEELADLEVYSKNDDGTYSLNTNCEVLKNPDDTIFGYVKDDEYTFKNVTITSEDETEKLEKYFNSCTISGSILKISPVIDYEARLPIDSGSTKTITIKISSEIYDDSIKMRNDYSWSYKANNSTDEKSTVVITCDNTGSITPAGGSYNIGETIDITFTLNDEYLFKNGWEVSNADAVIFSEADYDNAKKVYKIKATIIESTSLQIKPKCKPVNKINLNILSQQGTLSPSGVNLQYKENSTTSLVFSSFNEYQFIRWEVYDVDTNAAISNSDQYISFSKADEASTTFTINAIPEDHSLGIRPYCLERPTILTTTPSYSNSGCYRDEQITVLFDQPMDESSIYFSESEIPSGKVKIYSKRTGKTDKCYAYADSKSDPDEYGNVTYVNKIYKNIEIINLTTQELLHSNFDEPYFESNSKLIIRTAKKLKADGKFDSLAPDSSTQIVVSISKNMCALKENSLISLSTTKKWNYLTNQSIDLDPPSFYADADKPVLKVNKQGATYTTIDSKETQNYIAESSDLFELCNQDLHSIKDKKLEFYLRFKDAGSGPDSLFMYYKKFYDGNYNWTDSPEQSIQLSFKKSASGTDGYFSSDVENKTPDEISLSSLSDGIYSIRFGAKDLNGNEKLTDYYYILIDNTPAEISNFAFDKYTCNYSFNSTKNYNKVRIYDNTYASETSEKDFIIKSKNVSDTYKYTYHKDKSDKLNLLFEIEAITGTKYTYQVPQSVLQLGAPVVEKFAVGTVPNSVHNDIITQGSYASIKCATYGRTVKLQQNTNYITPTGYILYENNSEIARIPSSNYTFDIPKTTNGAHTYKIRSYVTIGGETYISSGHAFNYSRYNNLRNSNESLDCVFHETGKECLYAYTCYKSGNRVDVSSGVIENSNNTYEMYYTSYSGGVDYKGSGEYSFVNKQNFGRVNGSAYAEALQNENNLYNAQITDTCGNPYSFRYDFKNYISSENVFSFWFYNKSTSSIAEPTIFWD